MVSSFKSCLLWHVWLYIRCTPCVAGLNSTTNTVANATNIEAPATITSLAVAKFWLAFILKHNLQTGNATSKCFSQCRALRLTLGNCTNTDALNRWTVPCWIVLWDRNQASSGNASSVPFQSWSEGRREKRRKPMCKKNQNALSSVIVLLAPMSYSTYQSRTIVNLTIVKPFSLKSNLK